jgi:hypothetical protein
MAKELITDFFDQLSNITGGKKKSVWHTVHDPNIKWDVRCDAMNKISKDPDVGPLIKAFANKLSHYCVQAITDNTDDKADENELFRKAKNEYLATKKAQQAWSDIIALAEKKGFMDV